MLGNLVEQLVQGDEIRALHVPVSMLGLRAQVDRVGEPRIQQLDHLGAGVHRQIVLGVEHGNLLYGALHLIIATPGAANWLFGSE